MKKTLMLFLLGVLMVSGCAQNNADSAYENQDRAGQDLNTNENGVRGGDGPNFADDQDNDMTMSDQNPNLLNTDNENRHNFSQDIQQAKDVITAKGYEPGQIWINGGTMNVTVHHKGRLSKQERGRAADSLRKNLIRALPRYEINVEIE